LSTDIVHGPAFIYFFDANLNCTGRSPFGILPYGTKAL